MWWVNLGWMPDVHQAVLWLYLLSRMGKGEKTRWKKLVGQDKGSLIKQKQRPLAEAKENKIFIFTLYLSPAGNLQPLLRKLGFSTRSGFFRRQKCHSNKCPYPFLLAFIAGQIPGGMEYSLGQFGSAVPAVSPFEISLIFSLLVKGKCY